MYGAHTLPLLGFSPLPTQNINALGKKARDGTIGIDDMAGGTFTISNGGVYGSLLPTPIINPPQWAILGMHTIVDRPVVVKSKVRGVRRGRGWRSWPLAIHWVTCAR